MNDQTDVQRSRKAQEDGRNSCLISVMYTVIFFACHVMLNVATAWYVRKTRLHLFFAWIQSCFIMIFFWKRRRPISYLLKNLKSYPGIYFYVAFATINETCSNKLTANSTGSEITQLGLATSPLFLVLVTMWFDRKTQPSIVMAFVTMISLIMTVVVCSIDEPYFPFRFTIFNGLIGLFHGLVIALMVLSLRKQLISEELSVVQLVYSLNIACAVCFPCVMLVTGEINHVISNGLPGGLLHLLITVLFLAVLRVMDQASCLYQIKYTSSLVHNSTRGLAWVPVSLICVFTLKLELMIPSFVCFWLNIAIFLAVLVGHLTDINS